jgi:hypothetical protein
LTYVAQIPNRVSGAKLHSLTFRPIRRDTNGLPLEPAVMAKERGNVTPLLRLGRGQGEHGRFHTAGFTQGDNEMPMLGGDGILDLFIVVATVR